MRSWGRGGETSEGEPTARANRMYKLGVWGLVTDLSEWMSSIYCTWFSFPVFPPELFSDSLRHCYPVFTEISTPIALMFSTIFITSTGKNNFYYRYRKKQKLTKLTNTGEVTELQEIVKVLVNSYPWSSFSSVWGLTCLLLAPLPTPSSDVGSGSPCPISSASDDRPGYSL